MIAKQADWHPSEMKPLDEEIARIDREIARLKVMREGVVLAKELLSGNVSLHERGDFLRARLQV